MLGDTAVRLTATAAAECLERLGKVLTKRNKPDEAATAFLFGFFRRDYGAAGLAKIADSLTGAELVTAAVVLTLFLPCIAQFLVVWKERGWRMAIGVGACTFVSAIVVGALLSRILGWLRLPL